MSERYSISRVVAKVKGEPRATDQPRAISVASPVKSWCTAKEALMPAPFTSLPCSYNRRTEGPMPLGATSTTLMSLRNSAPSFFMIPSRKPCDRPRVAPGFIAARMRGYMSACAPSEMSSITRSLSAITSNTSPMASGLKPHASASATDLEPARRPTFMLMSSPAASMESRMFCAWAGPWDPQPMTPMVLMFLNASDSRGNKVRPPRTMYSVSPAITTASFSNTLVVNSTAAAMVTDCTRLLEVKLTAFACMGALNALLAALSLALLVPFLWATKGAETIWDAMREAIAKMLCVLRLNLKSS
mmetsp:Transcript_37732/g.63507  ORF Transcript_37732/g.63507 Transcript_37732/m.63507 type:complete len:302 (+) Transcript_37732:1106-2011(+)